jgi:hypothetical protein
MGEDHVWLQGNQLFRKRLKLIYSPGREASIETKIAALRPSELFKRLPERRQACLRFRIVFGVAGQYTDAPHAVGLLRVDRKRPCGGSAAEKGDDIASLHLPRQLVEAALDGIIAGLKE